MRGEFMRRPGVWCSVALLALALAVYARTMAPTTGYFDCGEFITAAHTLGIPHQPGTPLYVLVGRCFDLLLFFLSTARAVNFMSALFGALGVMLACRIVVEIASRSGLGKGWLVHSGGSSKFSVSLMFFQSGSLGALIFPFGLKGERLPNFAAPA